MTYFSSTRRALVLALVLCETSTRTALAFVGNAGDSGIYGRHAERTVCAERPESSAKRRALIGIMPSTFLALATPAQAKDQLFRPNPLTNPVLEQIRIWEQAEADNLKYGGELEAGDAGNKGKVGAYPKLLLPILQIHSELQQVNELVHVPEQDRKSAWPKAAKILADPKYQKIQFKKIFNQYGDNIYYSDPDRANVYLGGGATPKSEQSMAYLLRNDVLTNVEALQAELDYQIKGADEGLEDLYSYSDAAALAMAKYLKIVPPNELEAAQKIMSAK